jgi:hypothetical protein
VASTYPEGTLVRVATYAGQVSSPTGGFRDATGTLVDPLVVTLRYRTSEAGPVTTVTYPASPIVRDSAGLYRADLDSTGTGGDMWTYAWAGTGGVQAAQGGSFIVKSLF